MSGALVSARGRPGAVGRGAGLRARSQGSEDKGDGAGLLHPGAARGRDADTARRLGFSDALHDPDIAPLYRATICPRSLWAAPAFQARILDQSRRVPPT